MYLSRLEITGFKSFVDKTVIELQPGITAVVGPNGCGKTNICDAIRWVFGEENIRLLRGSKIEDVIFNGSQKRPAVGMAEVAITLSDVQDILPVEQSEITITRRVFRSGESEFFINKVPCRLKDIVDLFLGTGLGRRSYSVMERDMIDWILDDTNGQRRRIIEEAAGISKYKARRHETLNKLALTERDLERISDLIAEIEKRVHSLARQAAKARRYERIATRIRRVESLAAANEFRSMKLKVPMLERLLEEIQIEISDCSRSIDVAEAEIEKKRNDVLDLNAGMVEIGKTISEITQRLQKIESNIAILSERKSNISSRLNQVNWSIEGLEKSLLEKQQSVARKKSEIASLDQAICEEKKGQEDLLNRYQSIVEEIREERSRSVVTVRNALELARGGMEIASRHAELRSHQRHLTETIAGLEDRREQYKQRLGAVQEAVAADTKEIESLKNLLISMDNEIAGLGDTIEKLRMKISEIDQRRRQIERESEKASSHYEVLKGLVERFEGYREGVRIVMQAPECKGILGVVGDMVRCVDSKFEPAVMTALAEAMEYVVVEGTLHAADCVRALRSQGQGTAGFVVMERVKQAEIPSIETPGVLGAIVDFVECEPRCRGVIDHLLGQTYVVESLEKALELSAQFGDRFGFVTLEGDGVFRGSIVKSAVNVVSSESILGRKERLGSLRSEIEDLRRLAIEQEAAYQEIIKGLEAIEVEYRSKLDQKRGLEKKLIDLERALETKLSESGILEHALNEIDAQIDHKKSEVDRLVEEIERLQPLQPSEIDPASMIVKIGASVSLEEEAEQLRQELQEIDVRIAEGRTRLASLNETLSRFCSEVEQYEGEIRQLSDEISKLESQIREIDSNQHSLMESFQKDQVLLSEAEGRRQGLSDLKQSLEAEVEELRKLIKEKQRHREQLLIRRQELISEKSLLENNMTSLKRRMAVEYDVDVEKISDEEISEITDCEAELNRLKEALRSLGAVNLVAIEDYQKEKERYEFLLAQREDLLKARDDLNQAIVQINRKARAEFKDTFERVRQDFRKNFQILFGGGDADLRLQREDDPLEAPIEIFAQPPGKRLGQISLLSGGERALTSIAFLFAVYHSKPSPFCLLDEVDAPLDDINVRRFLNLIKELSMKTQFVVVTHNKKTMEAASCLYGVTMEEPGASRVVSVKLVSDAERLQTIG
ncbi:MAG: chromosome segregation protein SMC [bacterium]